MNKRRRIVSDLSSWHLLSLIMCAVVLAMAAAPEGETAAAQQTVDLREAEQNSVTVTVGTGSDGLGITVKHVISPSINPVALNPVDVRGASINTIEILTGAPDDGQPASTANITGDGIIVITPSRDDITVEYTVDNAVHIVDGIHTLDFLYLHTTVFQMPEDAKMIYVNNRAIHIEDKDGIACHGCQMRLEYVSEVTARTEYLDGAPNADDHPIQIMTRADIKAPEFDQKTGRINMVTEGHNQFMVMIIPTQLMKAPYTVTLDDNKIFFQNYFDNGTHVWLSFRPETPGNVAISGDTIHTDLQVRDEKPDDDGSVPEGMTAVVVVVVVAAVAAALLFVAKKRRKEGVSRHKNRTSRDHTRQYGSYIQDIFHHTLPPMAPFRTS